MAPRLLTRGHTAGSASSSTLAMGSIKLRSSGHSESTTISPLTLVVSLLLTIALSLLRLLLLVPADWKTVSSVTAQHRDMIDGKKTSLTLLLELFLSEFLDKVHDGQVCVISRCRKR